VSIRPIIAALRDADWLTGERARVYGATLAVGLSAMTIWLTVAPLRAAVPGGDFISFYAASALALAGHAGDAWRPDLHAVAQDAVLGPHGYLAFLYPPPYLLICWPLALLPFGAALAAWSAATLGLALGALAVFVRQMAAPASLALLLLALPGTWIDVLAGQNGALTLAILALGFALVDRRPVWAGIVLGLMVIKPQLAIMLPVVLLVSQRWSAVLAMSAGVFAALVIAWLAVGTDGYEAFLTNAMNARLALEGGAVDPALMQSLFGMLQPTSPMAAYAGQAILSAAVVVLVIVVVRRARPDGAALGALAVAATLAATPFLLDYDLAIAALPIAWIVVRGAQQGFRPWEKLSSIVCGALPLVSRTLAEQAGVHLAPLLCLLLLAIVARRILGEAAVPSRVALEAAVRSP
jgi:hypothetical protein